MKRTVLIGLSGLGYFIISLFLFMPFRMKPIENYNLFALPFFAIVFIFFCIRPARLQKTAGATFMVFSRASSCGSCSAKQPP